MNFSYFSLFGLPVKSNDDDKVERGRKEDPITCFRFELELPRSLSFGEFAKEFRSLIGRVNQRFHQQESNFDQNWILELFTENMRTRTIYGFSLPSFLICCDNVKTSEAKSTPTNGAIGPLSVDLQNHHHGFMFHYVVFPSAVHRYGGWLIALHGSSDVGSGVIQLDSVEILSDVLDLALLNHLSPYDPEVTLATVQGGFLRRNLYPPNGQANLECSLLQPNHYDRYERLYAVQYGKNEELRSLMRPFDGVDDQDMLIEITSQASGMSSHYPVSIDLGRRHGIRYFRYDPLLIMDVPRGRTKRSVRRFKVRRQS
jgi:hypothetical protein